MIGLTWLQSRLCPFFVIGTVGKLLALQTYAHVLWIFQSVLACDVCLTSNTLEVARVDLQTRFVGIHLHEDTTLWRIEAGAYL